MMARYFFVDYAISSISGVLFNCNLAHFSLVFFPIFVTYLGISLQKVQQKDNLNIFFYVIVL